MRLITKILIIVGLGIAASYLSGCRKKAQLDYGVYNVGVCMNAGQDFLASNVDFEKGTFTILANAEGPRSVQKEDPPFVLIYAGNKEGFRTYKLQINGHEDEIDVKVQNGELTGLFVITSRVIGRLHGHKGSLDNLGADGNVEARVCMGN
jgi:hypothetical protein